eukprot:365053-Chlamydomonas_euryale.AAC.14
MPVPPHTCGCGPERAPAGRHVPVVCVGEPAANCGGVRAELHEGALLHSCVRSWHMLCMPVGGQHVALVGLRRYAQASAALVRVRSANRAPDRNQICVAHLRATLYPNLSACVSEQPLASVVLARTGCLCARLLQLLPPAPVLRCCAAPPPARPALLCAMSTFSKLFFAHFRVWTSAGHNAMISNIGMVLRNIYSKKSLVNYKHGAKQPPRNSGGRLCGIDAGLILECGL